MEADLWWAGLSPERRKSIHRFLGPRHSPPGQDEVLPFAVPGIEHRLSGAQRNLLDILRSGPRAVQKDRAWVMLAGRRWQRRTLSAVVATGMVDVTDGVASFLDPAAPTA